MFGLLTSSPFFWEGLQGCHCPLDSISSSLQGSQFAFACSCFTLAKSLVVMLVRVQFRNQKALSEDNWGNRSHGTTKESYRSIYQLGTTLHASSDSITQILWQSRHWPAHNHLARKQFRCWHKTSSLSQEGSSCRLLSWNNLSSRWTLHRNRRGHGAGCACCDRVIVWDVRRSFVIDDYIDSGVEAGSTSMTLKVLTLL